MLLHNSAGALGLAQTITLCFRPQSGILLVELIRQARDVGLVLRW